MNIYVHSSNKHWIFFRLERNEIQMKACDHREKQMSSNWFHWTEQSSE